MSERSSIADILYGSYIRYDRLYAMTEFAFYGKPIDSKVNIFIDIYSIMRSVFKRGNNVNVSDSCVIASCFINMAIHLRAYFETRHRVGTRVYLVYGGSRPPGVLANYPVYNNKNIFMEDSNYVLKELLKDNLKIMSILCPYLPDIFYVIDPVEEFSVLVGSIIDHNNLREPNIIYSKDAMSYQLVAYEPFTFLYRPKKRLPNDISFVATKSTIYDAYRYGELMLNKEYKTKISPELFSIYLAIAGVRSRSMNSIKNATAAIKVLEKAIKDQNLIDGYNPSWRYQNPNPFVRMFLGTKVDPMLVSQRCDAIDFQYQKMLYKESPAFIEMINSVHQNLYDPQEVRNINDRYFRMYPLDLNRV